MSHIQSIFDLCPDIQEHIGKELAPLVKTQKAKKRTIHQCKYIMNNYDLLELEDYKFGGEDYKYKKHTGKMLLFLMDRFKKERAMYISKYQPIAEGLRHISNMCKKDSNKLLSRMIILDCLNRFHMSERPTKVNIYGFVYESRWLNHKNCIISTHGKYTNVQLDLFALQNGIKMPKSWNKDKKIHHLMKTEV
jgi:hypothetical protein